LLLLVAAYFFYRGKFSGKMDDYWDEDDYYGEL